MSCGKRSSARLEDGLITVTGTVTGIDLEFVSNDGETYLVDGTLQNLTFVLDNENFGTFTLFEMSNAAFDGAEIAAAVEAEDNGDLTALEELVMSQSYNAVLGSVSEEAGRNLTVGFDGADWNLRGDDIIRLGAGDDEFFFGDGNDKGFGQNGDDTLMGGRGQDKLLGGVGNDFVKGDKGDDRLFGGDDDDRVYGGTGNDNVFADSGNDRLYGGDGNDDMFGGAGHDRLYNGGGADNFTGGTGADRFQFQEDEDLVGSGVKDRIMDFQNGIDRIFLGGIDADTATGGDDAFTFIGYGAFSGTAGELRIWEDSNGNARVRGDVDGDGQRDFQIYVANSTDVFDAGDFLL